MDWEWFYQQVRTENEAAVAANGGTKDGLDECAYCGRLYPARSTDQCPHCDQDDARLREEAL